MDASARASLVLIVLLAGTAPAPGQDHDRTRTGVRFVSYNIRHGTGNDACTAPAPQSPPLTDCGYNLTRTAGIIAALAPDVAALQEVDRFWSRSAGEDQPARLGAALDMKTCYGPNLVHRADVHSSVAHEYGTLILSRFPIVTCRNVLLPNPGGEPRGLLEAVIDIDGALIRAYNTHLDTRLASRSAQTRSVAEIAGASPVPVVLMGDFNATPDAAEMTGLFARFRDAWAGAGAGTGFTHPATLEARPDQRIDYILVSRAEVTLLSAAVVIDAGTRMASDHYPLQAVLRLGAGD